MKKRPVKIYLTEEERQMLSYAASAIGEDLSSYIRSLIIRHLNDISLLKEKIHGAEKIPDRA